MRLIIIFCVLSLVISCNKEGSTGLTSIDSGSYGVTWWNREPYRLVQTNLREIDATMDVDAYVQSMVEASASIVLLNVGDIVANYPTELPFHYKNTYMEGDLVGDLIDGLHSKGIKMIGRYAKLENGFDYFLKVKDFDSGLDISDLVITGEGMSKPYKAKGHMAWHPWQS